MWLHAHIRTQLIWWCMLFFLPENSIHFVLNLCTFIQFIVRSSRCTCTKCISCVNLFGYCLLLMIIVWWWVHLTLHFARWTPTRCTSHIMPFYSFIIITVIISCCLSLSLYVWMCCFTPSSIVSFFYRKIYVQIWSAPNSFAPVCSYAHTRTHTYTYTDRTKRIHLMWCVYMPNGSHFQCGKTRCSVWVYGLQFDTTKIRITFCTCWLRNVRSLHCTFSSISFSFTRQPLNSLSASYIEF